jgi:hypothetical protein
VRQFDSEKDQRERKRRKNEKIATREVDPISVLDKAAESKRRVLIDKNFTVGIIWTSRWLFQCF